MLDDINTVSSDATKFWVRWNIGDGKTMEVNSPGRKEAQQLAKKLSASHVIANYAEIVGGNLSTVEVYENGRLREVNRHPGTRPSDLSATLYCGDFSELSEPASDGATSDAVRQKPKKDIKMPTNEKTSIATEKTNMKTAIAPEKTSTKKKGGSKTAVQSSAPATVGSPQKSAVAKKSPSVKKKMAEAREIVAEFGARDGTIRASAISLLAENLGKDIAVEDLCMAIYGAAAPSNRGAMSMVMQNVKMMIRKRGIPYRFDSNKIDGVMHNKLSRA